MKPINTNRLHTLRIDNDAHRYTMEEHAARFDGYRARHENGTAPRAVSAFQLFQTPEHIAARMVELARPAPGLAWLEPSAGLGRILRPIMETRPAAVTACESSPDCARELFSAFPDAVLWQRDFLTVEPPREGGAGQIVKASGPAFYDRVIMNPPFHMRADVRHTLHALKFLKTEGVLVGLCMATHHRENALRGLCSHWEKLPPETFAREGTRVETYLFRVG
jgi:phospholipid N-methyltransferase